MSWLILDSSEEVLMFDRNEFKRKVKSWMRAHPRGTEQDLLDYCDELIPPAQFAANQWLIEHTVSWYRHILINREKTEKFSEDMDEVY